MALGYSDLKKEMGTSGVHIDTSLRKAVWAEGIRMSPTASVCGSPEMNMKIHQARSIYFFTCVYVII